MSLPGPGARLGDYEIIETLGAGAMGVVYRARDGRLHRTVALKVLTGTTALTLPREQLLAEARAASALNHPGICTIHHVEHAAGHEFIVMEFVDGKRLNELIPSAGLRLDLVLRYASQIAAALAHAHERGVIHRDLKSANVMVTREGDVKIVDFGLARQFVQAAAEAATESHSDSGNQTVIGGTLAYMAPEVLQGESPTASSDLWAFGVLLYEMATGTLPFTGRTSFELTAQVLRSPFSPLPPHVPASLRTVIANCLGKEPSQRYRSAREIRAALEAIQSDTGIQPLPRRSSRPGRPVVWALSAAVLVAAAVLVWRVWPFGGGTAPPVPGQLIQVFASERPAYAPALSSDGSMVAYVAQDDEGLFDIYVSRVAGGGRVRITHDAMRESRPRFSPDGERLAFARWRPGRADPEICIVPAFGGQVSVIVPSGGQPVWSPDGSRLAFIRPDGDGAPLVLGTVRADGSDERVLVRGDGVYPFVRSPAWSPDGRSLAFVRGTGGVAGELWLVPSDGGELRRVSNHPPDPPAVFSDEPVFSADGRTIVHTSNRGGATNIWELPVGGGPAVRLTTGPGPDESPSVDRSGRLAFGNARWRSELALHHQATGAMRPLARHTSFLWAPAISPDGHSVAYSRSEVDGSWHIWLVGSDGGASRQLTSGEHGEIYPRWTPDGQFVIYNNWAAPRRVWRVPRDGGAPVALTPAEIDASFADVSPDGRWLIYAVTERSDERVHVSSIGGDTGSRLLRAGPASVPRWSPDGEWIAFAPNRSYSGGIFIIRPDGTGERQLTRGGGWPVWWPDSRHVSYLMLAEDGTQRIDTVGVDGRTGDRQIRLLFHGANHLFDIARDGARVVASNAAHVSSEIWVMER